MSFKIEKLKNLPHKEDLIHWGELISSLALFTQAQTIVEIGVQYANCTFHLCEAAERTGGFVFGYDAFEPMKQGPYKSVSYGSLEKSKDKLKDFNNFKLSKINTHTAEFQELLKQDLQDTPGRNAEIDLAFVDGCHSYAGTIRDFENLYPYMAKTGIMVFHDTYSHLGLRKLNIDLRTIFYDGTYDVIELPFGYGNRRLGLTILVKRSYPLTHLGITNGTHEDVPDGLDMGKDDVYIYEDEFLINEVNNAPKRNKND